MRKESVEVYDSAKDDTGVGKYMKGYGARDSTAQESEVNGDKMLEEVDEDKRCGNGNATD